ncbi:MAG: biotin--[acetyl-CoA-carboxylase] ligase [Synechococcales bacterium]|nr:biotin--[acetyl-CoA-carboxylase] ligase [Cyanobacteria bacterium REEB444]MEB3124650.1 biotin--[acetyl-CoA-carboxylase] ligase [Synechococcales bacterium]
MTQYPVALLNRQYPWLKFLPTCGSTNTWANEHHSALTHGDVVFTPQQTAGKGQQGKIWVSPPGCLTASFVLDGITGIPVGFTLVVGLAIIEVIEELLPELRHQLQLKWVNDVWLRGRKVAGILCERTGDRIIVGIGLNHRVTFVDPTSIGSPISLHEWVTQVPDELTLLVHIRQTLLKFVDRLICKGLSEFVTELNNRDGLMGHKIQVETEQCLITGEGMGLDEQGRLQVKTRDGQMWAIVNGRVVGWERRSKPTINPTSVSNLSEEWV